VSDVSDISLAAVSTGNLKTLAAGKGWDAFGALVASVDRIRGYGDFYQYHLLAAGKIEAVIESDVNILDIAALSVIVTEAGGTFTDLDGMPPGLGTTSVLATNGALHAEIRKQLEP
jgi:histidinol-phosphatase